MLRTRSLPGLTGLVLLGIGVGAAVRALLLPVVVGEVALPALAPPLGAMPSALLPGSDLSGAAPVGAMPA
eukprot:11734001-Alexandrium_andersonii.AAC.1